MNVKAWVAASCAAAIALTGCVSIERTKAQLASGNPAEVAKAEAAILEIASTGKDASGLMNFTTAQRVEYVSLSPGNDLLLKIIAETHDDKVISAAAERLNLKEKGLAVTLLTKKLDIVKRVLDAQGSSRSGPPELEMFETAKKGERLTKDFCDKLVELLDEKTLVGMLDGKIDFDRVWIAKRVAWRLLERTKDVKLLCRMFNGNLKYLVDDEGSELAAKKLIANAKRLTDKDLILQLKSKTKDNAARKALLSRLTEKDAVDCALESIKNYGTSAWNNGNYEGINDGVMVASIVKKSASVVKIASAVLEKLTEIEKDCKTRWGLYWSKTDQETAGDIITKVAGRLPDDMIEPLISRDSPFGPNLAQLFKDKDRASKLAVKFISESQTTKDAKKINKAWDDYNSMITEDKVLAEIAIKNMTLRDKALAKIKDEAVKARALAAIKAEQERLAAARREKLKKCLAVAERDADEMRLLYSYVNVNIDQKKIAKKATMGRLFYFKNVTVYNDNCSGTGQGGKRMLFSGRLDGSNHWFTFYGNFEGEYRAATKSLKESSETSVFGIAVQGESYSYDIHLNGMIVKDNDVASMVAFLEEHKVSDEMLDEMLSEKETVMRRFAKEQDLDFPEER